MPFIVKIFDLQTHLFLYRYCRALDKLFELIIHIACCVSLGQNLFLRHTTALPAALIFHIDLQPDIGFNTLEIPLPGRTRISQTSKQYWLHSICPYLLRRTSPPRRGINSSASPANLGASDYKANVSSTSHPSSYNSRILIFCKLPI